MDGSEILDCSLGCKLIRVGWIVHFWIFNKTHFVWLDPLFRPVNDPISIFLIKPNLYHVLFIKYLLISKILLILIGLKSTEKKFTTAFNPVFLSYY